MVSDRTLPLAASRFVILAACCLVLACGPGGIGPTDTPEPTSCGPVCESGDPTDNSHYRLCSPNGGELLRVGDTVLICVCSEDPTGYNLVDVETQISVDHGQTWVVFYTEAALDVRDDQKHWVIPDSVDYMDAVGNVRMASTVSDSVLLRVAAYGDESDFDRSDGYLCIEPRPEAR